MEITLSNSLKATFYGRKSLQTEKVLKVCDVGAKNRGAVSARWGDECMIKLRIDQELVYIVLSLHPPNARRVKKILFNGGITKLLMNTTYVVYHKTAYWWNDEIGEALLNSIKEEVAPSIYILTHAKNEKKSQ